MRINDLNVKSTTLDKAEDYFVVHDNGNHIDYRVLLKDLLKYSILSTTRLERRNATESEDITKLKEGMYCLHTINGNGSFVNAPSFYQNVNTNDYVFITVKDTLKETNIVQGNDDTDSTDYNTNNNKLIYFQSLNNKPYNVYYTIVNANGQFEWKIFNSNTIAEVKPENYDSTTDENPLDTNITYYQGNNTLVEETQYDGNILHKVTDLNLYKTIFNKLVPTNDPQHPYNSILDPLLSCGPIKRLQSNKGFILTNINIAILFGYSDNSTVVFPDDFQFIDKDDYAVILTPTTNLTDYSIQNKTTSSFEVVGNGNMGFDWIAIGVVN